MITWRGDDSFVIADVEYVCRPVTGRFPSTPDRFCLLTAALVFELVLVCAANPASVAGISVNRNYAVVTRGEAELDPQSFELAKYCGPRARRSSTSSEPTPNRFGERPPAAQRMSPRPDTKGRSSTDNCPGAAAQTAGIALTRRPAVPITPGSPWPGRAVICTSH